jgi:hypothetical protein
MALAYSTKQTFSTYRQHDHNTPPSSPKMETKREHSEFDGIHIGTKIQLLFDGKDMEYPTSRYTMSILWSLFLRVLHKTYHNLHSIIKLRISTLLNHIQREV